MARKWRRKWCGILGMCLGWRSVQDQKKNYWGCWSLGSAWSRCQLKGVGQTCWSVACGCAVVKEGRQAGMPVPRSGNEEGIDAAAVSGPVLLHAAEPRRGRHYGEALPPEQNCRRVVLESGSRSDFRGNGVRAGEEGLAGADDPQYRSAAGKGRAAARCFHAAYGQIRFANQGQRRNEPLWRFREAAYCFTDFDAGRFDSSDDRCGHGGALPGTKDCDDDMDRRRRKFDRRVSRMVEFCGYAEGAVRVDPRK